MTTYEGAAKPAAKQKERRDWLYPFRVLGLLIVAPPLLLLAALASAMAREEDVFEAYHE